ncbi:MAG: UDP-N-acetylmuramate--L-alanine ligase [Actinomycetota bacterium]|nr:UDP-N-acetylmuramate--L-alanine ligase [Actinomycetota bacterium]
MVDLTAPRRVHVVGVGGSGMGPIATILAAMGHTVSGSDLAASRRLDHLRSLGVAAHVGHAAEHVAGADVVIVSTAVPADNAEVVAARAAGIPVARRAEALAALCAARRSVAVSGTHGKTTTTAMLAVVLREAGLRPSFLVGGEVTGLGQSATWDGGEWFVVEADESDGTFLELGADAVIVTSVEPDHLDHYGTFDAVRQAFAGFLVSAPGAKVVCVDDPVAAELVQLVGLGDCLTYGTAPAARYRILEPELGGRRSAFTLEGDGRRLGRIELGVPGLHNVRDATAAAVAAMAIGVPFDAVAVGLGRFTGVARRFEWRGEAGGVNFVDSYDHLPAEVRAALAAARAGGWRRVVCVFQPHRYTRTAALSGEFASAFDEADVLAVTDVYAAGQQPLPGVTGKLIVDAVLDARPHRRVAWLPRRPELVAWLRSELRPGDLCLTLGAGDLTTVPDQLLRMLDDGRPPGT